MASAKVIWMHIIVLDGHTSGSAQILQQVQTCWSLPSYQIFLWADCRLETHSFRSSSRRAISCFHSWSSVRFHSQLLGSISGSVSSEVETGSLNDSGTQALAESFQPLGMMSGPRYPPCMNIRQSSQFSRSHLFDKTFTAIKAELSTIHVAIPSAEAASKAGLNLISFSSSYRRSFTHRIDRLSQKLSGVGARISAEDRIWLGLMIGASRSSGGCKALALTTICDFDGSVCLSRCSTEVEAWFESADWPVNWGIRLVSVLAVRPVNQVRSQTTHP